MKSNWYDNEENEMTDDAFAVIHSLAIGVSKGDVSEDTGVSNDLIEQWLEDPEFVAEVKFRNEDIEKSIREKFEISSPDKKWHVRFILSCDFWVCMDLGNTKKQRALLMKKYLDAFRKTIFKACEPVDKKKTKELKKTRKILMES